MGCSIEGSCRRSPLGTGGRRSLRPLRCADQRGRRSTALRPRPMSSSLMRRGNQSRFQRPAAHFRSGRWSFASSQDQSIDRRCRCWYRTRKHGMHHCQSRTSVPSLQLPLPRTPPSSSHRKRRRRTATYPEMGRGDGKQRGQFDRANFPVPLRRPSSPVYRKTISDRP